MKRKKTRETVSLPISIVNMRVPLGWSKEYRAGWDEALSVLQQLYFSMQDLTWQMDHKGKAKKK